MTTLELLAQHGISCRHPGEDHHVGAGWIGIECPRCGKGSGQFHAAFPADGFACHCWRCGKLNLGEVLAELTGRSKAACWKLIGGMERIRLAAEPGVQGKLQLPPHGPLLPVHRNYLLERGFDPDELVNTWQLSGIGMHARLAWRLLLPMQRGKQVVSWTTRASTDAAGRRYINAKPEEEAVPIKHLLFGAHLAGHTVIVCEGPLDACRIGPGAVALLGMTCTREQLLLLSRYPCRAVAFDSEPAAQQQARRLCEALAAFDGVTKLVEIDAPDPGSADEHEIKLLRKEFLE